MSFEQFALWLMTLEGVNAVLGAFYSFVVPQVWPEFGELDPRVRRVFFMALSLLVPLVGAVVAGLRGYILLDWDNAFWPALVAGMTAFTMSQAVHLRDLERKNEPAVRIPAGE